MSTAREMIRWGAREWEQWSGIDAGAPRQPRWRAASGVDAPAASKRVAHARAILGCGLFAALLSALPYRLPGEARNAELRSVERPLCHACSAAQQITAAALTLDQGRPWLTVRFAAPPQAARFQVLLGPAESPIQLEQRVDGQWTMTAPRGSAGAGATFMAGARGDRVVFELPPEGAGGAVIHSNDGVRFPAAVAFVPVARAVRSINLVDLVIAVAVIAGAWRGYRGGALTMARHVAAVAIIVMLLKVAGRALVTLSGPAGMATAFAYGAAIALAGIAVHMLVRHGARVLFGPRGTEPRERGLGVVLGVTLAAAVAAMLLAVLRDQALADAVSVAIERSVAGSLLVDAWRALIL